jgi:pyruvate,water dikinase
VPPRERVRIYERVANFASPPEYFIRNLAEGVGTIAAAFFPKPVIVRLSDFTAAEYAQLLGGTTFEATPADGLRGAARYDHIAYADGFALECEALRRVRDEMGLTNVIVSVPFCHNPHQAQSALNAMARARLPRGKNGLEVYAMCALSATEAELDAYAKTVDGFSIGSSNLPLFELDPAMSDTLRGAVAGARRNERRIGMCDAELAFPPDLLTEIGIDWISVDPSNLLRTIAALNQAATPPETQNGTP